MQLGLERVQLVAPNRLVSGYKRSTSIAESVFFFNHLPSLGFLPQNQVSSRKCWFDSDRGHHLKMQAGMHFIAV